MSTLRNRHSRQFDAPKTPIWEPLIVVVTVLVFSWLFIEAALTVEPAPVSIQMEVDDEQ